MLFQRTLTGAVVCFLLSASVCAAESVYALSTSLETGNNQLGTIDITTGAFGPIGSEIAGSMGLTYGATGSLATLAFDGNLNMINPATGVTTVVGPTGLGDCSSPSSPCGPNAVNTIGGLGGMLYATDLANNLYRVNSNTGAATLIGRTRIPALPFVPLSTNSDGTFNAYDETLFGANGRLYATFDAFTVNSSTFELGTVLIPDRLYQIDPATGLATVVADTDLNLAAVAFVNGTAYAFNANTNQILTLDLGTGRTNFVINYDSPGILVGAVATPEPWSVALTGIGIFFVISWKWRRRTEPSSEDKWLKPASRAF
jgi:hypothetical protein